MNERKNVYNLPVGDTTLEWYAKAVAAMRTRPATDPTSWKYQAAIHGFDPRSPYWSNVGTLPSAAERKEFWAQCQHQSYFFLPWHRMYLAYFEQIVAQTIIDIGGPANWCLPFWDYTDIRNPNARAIPKAFTSPATGSNSLWMPGRSSQPIPPGDVTLEALDAPNFIGIDDIGAAGGFGGPETPFSHFNNDNGRLEEKPHNLVHSDIEGAMGNPDTAALDPIFWLHHANIDRMWQIWLNTTPHTNPTKSSWLDFAFDFHDKSGSRVELKCSDVIDTRQVLTGYTYEGTAPGQPAVTTTLRTELMKEIDLAMPLEVVAATNKHVALKSEKTSVKLKLTPPRRKKGNFTAIMENLDNAPKTILKLENVKGKGTPPAQDVYLNLPKNSAERSAYLAGSVSLFGVEGASKASLHSSGSGQTYTLDVSKLITKLRSSKDWDDEQLDISIEPRRPMDKDSSVTIGRISLYSE